MADVLLARATGIEGFERHVVIKRIRAEQARDSRFVQMFLDEARLAASLHHTNIVDVHDIGQEDGEYFFTMEYVHGEDLRKLLMHVAERDERVPFDHLITIVLAACAALHHAHEQKNADRQPLGIVHRDVSPANILVGYDGNVKVVDFGIAKASHRTTETHSGLMKGKVAYMSPEQCVGQPVDRRSDIFCLGIVLYELATVRRLFKGANDFLTMSSITHGVIPKPSELRPDIPPALEAIILKALSANPADRYQTADQMRSALERYAVKAGLRTSTTALADYMLAQFGERPVPWLADEDEPEVELTYDFDGSNIGVVPAPNAALHEFAVPAAHSPNSPIMKARTKAITDAPPLPPVPPVGNPDKPILQADPDLDVITNLVTDRSIFETAIEIDPEIVPRTKGITGPPDKSGTLAPEAIAAGVSNSTGTHPGVANRRLPRRMWWAIGGGVGVIVLVSVIAAAASSSNQSDEQSIVAPAIAPPVRPPPVEAPKPAPVELTVAHDEAPPETPKPAIAKKPVKPKAPPVEKKPVPPRGKWDPNSLFPKK
jgi:serine/threonine protein kinase